MPVSVSDWILYFFMVLLLPAVIAYFCGCFNGAVIVSKYILRDDVRSHGSGNAGLTNFYRTFGGPLTAVVILTDVLKAVVAVLVASALLGGTDFAKYWAGLFCLLGHMFPCMFHFRGGKGILSGGAIAIMIDWRVALVVWGGFLILAVATKYVSLGSCWAGSSLKIPSFWSWPFSWEVSSCGSTGKTSSACWQAMKVNSPSIRRKEWTKHESSCFGFRRLGYGLGYGPGR